MPSHAPIRWNAPHPSAVLGWQRRQEVYTRTNLTALHLGIAIRAGNWTLLPTPALHPERIDTVEFATKILMSAEAQRLAEARTYSIGPNTTGLAVAAAAGSAPREEISESRAPSPTGLMIFADPIGSDIARFASERGETIEIHTPIVAVSWSSWGQEHSQLLGEDCPLTWLRNSEQHGLVPIAPDLQGIWMTFYAARVNDTHGLSPNAPAAVGSHGEVVTVREAAQAEAVFARSNPHLFGPLIWHNELLLPSGETFSEHPPPNSAQEWASIVYTVWQIMQQTGAQQLVEVRDVAEPPAARKKTKAKAKQRGQQAVVGDGVVRVVDLAAPHRPAANDTQADAAASDGRSKVQWTCRWPVPPHRRRTCTNPYLHHRLKDDSEEHHTHREDVIPFKIKGPKDKPLRVKGGTTFTFDTPNP
ncbi:hypothetical protein ACFWBX_09005 [Streptomyces sp. NPDC059991]|uniref:hypothetical protein n=1 Tax=Streptomyces sp. NPDC059991 TaxID=3347028 RepID=UPI00368D08E0